MARGKKVAAVLRVSAGDRYLGDILLDGRDRVWRRADTIPAEIVLKALAAHTRGAERGEVVGRLDGQEYRWFLMGSEAALTAA
jgi:hypothetical protein